MIDRDGFLALMRDRYACKRFSAERRVDDAEAAYVLECGRLSPSSFGLEHWHFFAARSASAIANLRKACFDQDAVGTASLVVVIAARRAPAYDPQGPFVASRGSRFPGTLSAFVEDFSGYYDFLRENNMLDHWARSQCYLACANMMTGAVASGIDSCAIEGYDNEMVLESLGLSPCEWETGIVVAFGHAALSESREKIRAPFSEVVTYV